MRTRALVEAVRLISASTHNVDETLDALAEQAKRLLGADGAALTFVDSDGCLIARRAPVELVHLDNRIAAGTRFEATGITVEAIATRRPVFSEHFQSDPRITDESRWRSPSVEAAAAIPLVAGDEVLGMLYLGWTRAFVPSAEDVEIAEALGAHAAVAIRTARLLERTRVDAERSERSQVLLAALSKAHTLKEVGAAIVRDGIAAVGARGGVIALVSTDGADLEIVSAEGYASDVVEPWRRFPITAEVPLAEAARTGEPVFAGSAAAVAIRYPMLAETQARDGEGAIMALPLRLADRMLGSLGLSFSSDRGFEEDEREAMLVLAQRAVLALDRARLYDALRTTSERYRIATETAAIAVWEWDTPTNTLRWSGAGLALFGYASDAVTDGRWLADKLHPDEAAQLFANFGGSTRSGAARGSRECRIRRADGGYAHCLAMADYRYDAAGQLLGAIGVFMDITPRRAAEAERDRLAEELARADERERVAMDLHDNLMQHLYGAALTVGAAKRDLASDPAAAIGLLSRVATTLDSTIGSVRGYMESLRSVAPARAGLRAGLNAIVGKPGGRRRGGNRVGSRAGELPRIDLRVAGSVDDAMASEMVGEVLSIAREAVSNALRHGRAAQISVRASRWRGRLLLTVRDDGIGFDSQAAPAAGRGLANMAARAERLGGALAVESAHEQGTTVRLELPLTVDQPPSIPRR